MKFRHLQFDDLIGMDGVTHLPASRPVEHRLKSGTLEVDDTLDDVVVLNDVLLMRNGGLVWKDVWLADAIHYMPKSWQTAKWLPGKYDSVSQTVDIDAGHLLAHRVHKEPALFVDTYVGQVNFGHFVHDSLPYGLLYQRLLAAEPPLRPLIRPLKYPNQHRLFSIVFGVDYERAAFGQPGVRIETLFLPRRQTVLLPGHWQVSFAGIRHIRDAASRVFCGEPESQCGGYDIYLHRILPKDRAARSGPIAGRDFANYDELCDAMMKLGYIVMEPGLVSIDRIAGIVSQARNLMSVHGAGLANLIFAPPGTKVWEIRAANGNWRSLEVLCAVLGHEFHAIQMKDASRPLRLDIAAIAAALTTPS
jgi:Glycosyltransferase 61